jgi:hypothetical protein
MEKRFIIPAVSFLAGLVIWIAALLVIETGSFILSQELLLGLITGGLIFFSAYRCKKADGPRGGNIFRTIILLVLATLSYFFIGIASAMMLLAAAVATSILVFMKLQPIQNKLDKM